MFAPRHRRLLEPHRRWSHRSARGARRPRVPLTTFPASIRLTRPSRRWGELGFLDAGLGADCALPAQPRHHQESVPPCKPPEVVPGHESRPHLFTIILARRRVDWQFAVVTGSEIVAQRTFRAAFFLELNFMSGSPANGSASPALAPRASARRRPIGPSSGRSIRTGRAPEYAR